MGNKFPVPGGFGPPRFRFASGFRPQFADLDFPVKLKRRDTERVDMQNVFLRKDANLILL